MDYKLSQDVKELIKKISETNYYEGNKRHSIEHIQKVIFFSDVISEGEKISDSERKILLTAAAFHDSGRKIIKKDGSDSEQKDNHALVSAEFVKPILESSSEFGKFSEQEIGIIQAMIEYHEYPEYPTGSVEKMEIARLADKYNVKENTDEIEKLAVLLKDADALDRYRFAKRGRLNPEYLHSKTAKQEFVMKLAENVNNDFAKEILEKIYKVSKEKIEQEEKKGESTTLQLREKRLNEGMSIEPHISVDDIIKIFERDAQQINIEQEEENKINKIQNDKMEANKLNKKTKKSDFFNMNGVELDYNDLKRVNDEVYNLFKDVINIDDDIEK